ncbi:MAG: T9SS type A sorting domain-containing protein [Chitinophagales bacterium]|nr:T9SS type A sorting domain-containing protein [Chitinophagales bacterium]
MNKLLPFTLILFALAATFTASAQYCGGSGPSVCTAPATLPGVGFYPPYDSMPCAVIDSAFDQTINFMAPTTVTQGTSTYPLNWIRVDTISNLPCGLCWRMGNSNNQINGGGTGCVRITGTTKDAPGQYKIRVIVTANVTVGFFPVNVGNQNAESLGVKYFARVKAPGGSCPDVDTLAAGNTATVPGSLTAPTINGSSTICTGGNTTLSVSGGSYYAYKWSNGSFNSSINVTSAGTYTVTVYGNCASATATKTITVSNPSPSITPSGPITFCQGSSATLNAGAGFASYAWSNGATTQTINVTTGGTYTVTVTQSGCTGTDSKLVTVNNTTVTVSANGPTTFCQGGSVTLDAGAGYANYSWSNGASTQTINATTGGTYTVTVTQNNCTASDNKVVTVNSASVNISPSGATTFCQGGSVTLDAGSGYSNYSWSTGSSAQSVSATQTGVYSVTVTDQNSCTAADSETITVNNTTVSISANGPTTFCQGGSVTLDAGAGYSSYSWSNSATTQSITVTQGNTYTVTVTLNSCSATDSKVVTVTSNNLTPTIVASGSTNICPGASVTLNAGVGYDSYSWSDGSSTQNISVNTQNTYTVTVTQGTCTGTDAITVNVGNFPVSVSISPAGPITACVGDVVTLDAGAGFDSYSWSTLTPTQTTGATTNGTYTVTVTQNFCTGTDAVSITFNNLPVVSISPSGTQNLCQGQSVTFDAGNGFDTYAWSTNETTQSITVNQGGTFSVTVTENGCSASDNVSVALTSSITPTITPQGPVNVCPGGFATLDVGAGYDTYLWSTTDNTQDISVATQGTYTVTVTLGACSGTASVSVTNNAAPLAVNITPAGPISACAGDQITLDAGAGFSGYLWSNTDQSQTTTVTSSGSYIVTVMKNGCVGHDTVVVNVHPIPSPNITPSGTQTICSGQTLTANAGAGYDTYLWSNGATTQTVSVTSQTVLNVTVTKDGCTGSSGNATTVNVNPLPNASLTLVSSGSGSAILKAEPAGASYQWLTQTSPTGPYTVTSNTTQYDTVSCGSTPVYHTVVVTQNGCSDSSSQLSVVCVGINETVASFSNVSISPNPTQGRLNISFELKESAFVEVVLTDITGRVNQKLLNERLAVGAHQTTVDVSGLAQGIYLLHFVTERGSYNTKFVKE